LLVGLLRTCGPSLAPLRLLAEIQKSLGRPRAESAVLQQLLSLSPLDGVAWRRTAQLAASGGAWQDAERAYRRACELEPREASNWEGLALSGIAAGSLDSATHAVLHLEAHFTGRASSRLIAGHLYKATGEDERALAAYQQALAIAPELAAAIYNLVDLKTPEPGHPLVKHAAELSAQASRGDADRTNLGFALGRVFEAASRYDEAFTYYALANEAAQRVMAQRGILYKPESTDEHVTRTVAQYPVGSTAAALDPLPIDLRLIFIVGMPRSGTTLIEQILGSHPRVRAGGELPFAVECERLHATRRKELKLEGPVDASDPRERELLFKVRELYLDRLFARDLDAEYVTDKLPGNFSRLGLIRCMFPDAVIVHCRRDPEATGWSLYTSNFAIHEPYYNSLEHLAHFYRSYQGLMRHWRSALSLPIVEMRYEGLVKSPEGEIRRLLAAVGLNWNEQCLAFHESRRPIVTASSQQVRRGIYTSSLERWRPYEARLTALTALRGEV
jgi:tetratricopeptide (TPR) repeat protein